MQSLLRYCKSSSRRKISHHAVSSYALLCLRRQLPKHGSPVSVVTTRDPICEDGGDSSRDAEAKKPHSAYSPPYFALPRTALHSLTNFFNPVSFWPGVAPGFQPASSGSKVKRLLASPPARLGTRASLPTAEGA